MDPRVIIYTLVAVAIVMVAVFVGLPRANVPARRNYRALFIVGLSWIPIGLATGERVFWILGAVFLMVALANRDKWER